MTARFLEICRTHIRRDGIEDLLNWLETTDFFEAPASTKYHGAHTGGLCEHSVNVWEEFCRLNMIYPEIIVNMETVAIVTLFHDLCKIGCYKTELRNRKENGVWRSVPTYVFSEDFPFGSHGGKSVFLIQRHMPLTDEEAVAINCHMGAWDRSAGDYGVSNAYNRYPLAWLLHVADESATYIREANI